MTPELPSFALDLDAARRHLAALDSEDATFIFAALPERPRARARPRHLVGRLSDVAGPLAALQRAGCGVFVTVNAMRGRRRSKAEVACVRAVWAERDRPGPDLPLPPSLIVATSPGRRHDYWLIDPRDPLAPDDAVAVNRQIAARSGADRAAVDLARLLRLAGSLNLKREPARVRIAGIRLRRYGAAELRAAFPAPPPRRHHRILPIESSATPRDVIDRTVAELVCAETGTRNATLNRAAFRLARLGLDAERIAALLTPAALAIGLSAYETAATIHSGSTAGARAASER